MIPSPQHQLAARNSRLHPLRIPSHQAKGEKATENLTKREILRPVKVQPLRFSGFTAGDVGLFRRSYQEAADLSKMTRASPPPILTELQNPKSTESQIAALRKLKNEIIGHDQRKEAWITWGIIPILSKILAAKRGSGKRGVPAEHNGEKDPGRATEAQLAEDEACLQAIILVGSFAQGTYIIHRFSRFPETLY